MIPRVIHHIWLGGKMPPSIKSVYENNKKILSDFDHRLWGEGDIPNSLPPTIKQALNKKVWAFVSDYMRFHFLKKYGGIYLDSDMIVLRDLAPLLHEDCFAGINHERSSIYCGIIGAAPQKEIIKNCIKSYWEIKTFFNFPSSPEVFTRVVENSLSKSISVYHPETFYPKKPESPYSYTFHRYDESWRRFIFFRRILRRLGIIKYYHLLTEKNKAKDFSFRIIDKSNLTCK